MRNHFNALVVGTRLRGDRHELEPLGATVVFEKLDTAMERIKTSWNLAVDVIVIDQAYEAYLGFGNSADELRPVAFAEELLGISEAYCMANGVRWRAVPIAYVSYDGNLLFRLNQDPNLRRIKFLGPSSQLSIRVDWEDTYPEIHSLAAGLWHKLVETLPSLGIALGLDVRGIVKERFAFRKRDGFRKIPENDLYDAARDHWLREPSKRLQRVRALVAPAENAIASAIERLAAFTFSGDAPERDIQFLFEMFPALIGALPHELFPQARFVTKEGGKVLTLPADLVTVRGGLSGGRSLITELKRGRTRLTTHGRRSRASADAMDTVTQARDYRKLALAEDIDRVTRIFGGPLESVATQVILGRARDADAGALAQMRTDFRDVLIRGFDEVLDEAISRWEIGSLTGRD